MRAALSPLLLTKAAQAVAVVVFVGIGVHGQGLDPTLQYMQRGDHYEGLRAIPISGSVQLLSARVVSSDRQPARAGPRAWTDRATLRFYLPRQGEVTLTIRQLRSRSIYYVLNRVAKAWSLGVPNDYSWETTPVLRKLTNLLPEDLGAVVNLGTGQDTNHETVLPVVLFDDGVDGGTKSYRFVFKTDGRVRVDATVFTATPSERPLFKRDTNWEKPGSPFTVLWNSAGQKEGWYRLVLSGQFEDGTRLDKEVTFYHRPVLGDVMSTPR